ncbi:MAG: CoA-transferase subunit beta [Deltaproteobacteria bacterium]|nr:CoA-transferase subunit beta [Deltaproteobacteria bacterium]MBW2285156.1 CoA-transferase subunit beta [Deltaproteobacteria bacterium]
MPDAPQPPSPVERMIVSASRLIDDNSVLMVGTQWPIISVLLAKSLHAPNIAICFEGGVMLGRIPDRIPLFTGDPVSNACALLMGDCFDTLGMVLHAGRADTAIISGASVDRFGNINTTCIGDYASPKIRLGGSGGACDFGSLSSRTVIVMEHDKRRFPERVDFITTPGYLQGGDSREQAGLKPGTGPYAVVTTLGLFHFDEEGEMVLHAYHASASVEKVRQNVQWDLKVHRNVRPLEPPTEEELDVLRNRLDPRGMYLKAARQLEGVEIEI